MENNSIEKNLSEIEIYSITALVENRGVPDSHATLERGLAVMKAYDMYHRHKDNGDNCIVFIDTWKNEMLIKTEYINREENLAIWFENHNV